MNTQEVQAIFLKAIERQTQITIENEKRTVKE